MNLKETMTMTIEQEVRELRTEVAELREIVDILMKRPRPPISGWTFDGSTGKLEVWRRDDTEEVVDIFDAAAGPILTEIGETTDSLRRHSAISEDRDLGLRLSSEEVGSDD